MSSASPANRLPPTTRLGRVQLQVAGLDRSIAYYERVLGLRVVQRDENSAVLAAHGEDTPLIELRERSGARPAPRNGRLGLYHFAILLPERAALARFVKHLAALGEYAGMSDHAVSEAIYLTDPDGLGIEVYADRPRSTWSYHAGELAMTTLPLDVDDLVRAAGDHIWNGMPAGTVMGHVHLHVDDLERAAEFYHGALGFDKTLWSYPQALFMSAGGYHHHLGTNTWARGAASPSQDEAQLLEWVVVVPAMADVRQAARSLDDAGHATTTTTDGFLARDPWGTTVRVRSAQVGA